MTAQRGFSTRCVHAGTREDPMARGVNTPLSVSSAFRVDSPPSNEAAYPRYLNIPVQEACAAKIAALEGAEAGLVLASGLTAMSMPLLTILSPGDHAVFQADIYGGTHHFVEGELARWGVDVTFTADVSPEGFAAATRPNTRVYFLESPSNPLLRIVDVAGVAAVARERGVVTLMDNTFATPINQNPLALGVDIVAHSGTKYLNGHSDLGCGLVASSREWIGRIRETAVNIGAQLNVLDCYLLERGMKTLALRVARHNENGRALAEFLEKHPLVKRVSYPGLPSHPDHALAARQMRGFGGMLAFELDCDLDTARGAVRRLKLIANAVSLGGVESLICFPAETSHEKMEPTARRAAGISDTLLRISAGIEETGDLLDDLEQALKM